MVPEWEDVREVPAWDGAAGAIATFSVPTPTTVSAPAEGLPLASSRPAPAPPHPPREQLPRSAPAASSVWPSQPSPATRAVVSLNAQSGGAGPASTVPAVQSGGHTAAQPAAADEQTAAAQQRQQRQQRQHERRHRRRQGARPVWRRAWRLACARLMHSCVHSCVTAPRARVYAVETAVVSSAVLHATGSPHHGPITQSSTARPSQVRPWGAARVGGSAANLKAAAGSRCALAPAPQTRRADGHVARATESRTCAGPSSRHRRPNRRRRCRRRLRDHPCGHRTAGQTPRT